MDQHGHSPVRSQTPVRCPPDSLEGLVLTEEPGQPWSLLLPISSSSWNRSSLLSMRQQRNETYPPTISDRVSLRLTWVQRGCLNVLALPQGNAVGIMYNSLLSGHTPNRRPTLDLSDEVRKTSVFRILSNINTGSKSSVAKTHQHSFIAPVARPYYLPRFDIDSAQSRELVVVRI